MKEKFNLQIDPCFEILKFLGLNITQLKGRQQFYRQSNYPAEIFVLIEEYIIRDINYELKITHFFKFSEIWFLETHLGYEMKIGKKIKQLNQNKHLEEKVQKNKFQNSLHYESTYEEKYVEIEKEVKELNKELDNFEKIIEGKWKKLTSFISNKVLRGKIANFKRNLPNDYRLRLLETWCDKRLDSWKNKKQATSQELETSKNDFWSAIGNNSITSTILTVKFALVSGILLGSFLKGTLKRKKELVPGKTTAEVK